MGSRKNRHKLAFAVLCFVALIILVGIDYSLAAVHYVSPSGTGGWAQSVSRDSPSSASTAMSNAVAGDIIYFLNGTYDVGQQGSDYHRPVLNPTNSGSSGSGEGDGYITFKAENRLGATINGAAKSGSIGGRVLGSYGKDWIIWDGFKVTCDGGNHLAVTCFDDADHCIIKNCELVGAAHSTGGAFNWEGLRIEHANYITINNCYIHGYRETSENHNTSGYKSYSGSNVTIEYCTFHNNTGHIYAKENCDSHTIRYNFLKGVTGGVNIFYQTKSTGHATGAEIYQNVIIGGNCGIQFNDSDSSYDIQDANIYNNSFYDIDYALISVEEISNLQAWNNIGVVNSNSDFQYRGVRSTCKPTYLDYNRYYTSQKFELYIYTGSHVSYSTLAAWQSGESLDANSLYGDPGYVNAGGTSVGDYKRNSYPTDGRGGAYESVMGAYIDGTETIGYILGPPSPPSRLRVISVQ